jgi:hypothetical protein
VSGLGTGIATALAVNTGSSGAPVINGGVLGTPSSGTVTNLTGTASININGTVGATTASTGAFTTLTTSSTVTINGGTANCVGFLNASKVLTTASALQFDGFGSLALSNNNSGGTNDFSVANTNATGYAALTIKNTGASGKTYEAGVGGNSTAGNYQNNFYIRNTTGNPTFALNLDNIIFIPGGTTEVARFTSTGLGIGTSSPSVKLDVNGTNGIGRFNSSDADGVYVTFANNGTAKGYIGSALQIITSGSANDFAIHAVNNFVFSTGGAAERARIDSSGNMFVGRTSDSDDGGLTLGNDGFIRSNRNGGVCILANRFTSDGQCVVFRRSGTTVGSIDVTTVLTTYNTTSDYRLKTVIGAVTGHGARIDALEPVEYTWNSNGSRTRGFLAHKFQEVYADSVSGTKDAVDKDGKPEYQSMQASSSEVIADLVAEIQSLRVRVAQLETN